MLTDPQWRHARAPTTGSAIDPNAEQLRSAARTFAAAAGNTVLANPHHEPQPDTHARHKARGAAVLIAFVRRPDGLQLVLTRRQARLRFGGHIALPGGHMDDADASPEHTALREAHEEIGVAPAAVDVIGRLPPYFTHSGHRITGVLALLPEDMQLQANPAEVAAIYEVPAASVFSPARYRLLVRSRLPYRANYVLDSAGITIGGPTLSLLIHLYDALNQALAPTSTAPITRAGPTTT